MAGVGLVSGSSDHERPINDASQLEIGEQALHVDGDLVTARAAFGRAFERAELDRDAPAMACAAIGLGGLYVHEFRATVDAAKVEARQRLALSQLDPGSTLALRLRIRLAAEADYRASSSSTVRRLLAEARALGEPLTLAEALSLAHHCVLGPDHVGMRMTLADELLMVAASTRRPSDTVMGLLWRTADLFLSGDRQAERAYAELADEESVSRNAAVAYAMRAMRVMLTIRAGRLAEAETLAEACARAGAAAGDNDWLGWYAAQVIAVRWYQGRIGELVDSVSSVVNSPTLSVMDNSFVAAQAVVYAAAGLGRQARGALARITGRDLADLPKSSSWLAAMAGVIEAAALLNDRHAASRAYQLLLPYSHLPVMATMGVACFGSAQHPLGLACLVTGEVDQAVEHFAAAIAHNSALGHWPAVTLSRHRLAHALSARGAAGDARRAAGLSVESAAEAAELGMRLPSSCACPGRSKPVTAVCTQLGRRWRIELRGRAAVVDDLVGLRYLATLVANPGVDIPAVDLVKPAPGTAVPELAAQRIVDGEALRQYRARLRELATDINAAEASGDTGQAGRLRSEADWLLREVKSNTGPSGQPRQFADSAERARIAVGKAIRRALDRVTTADPVIGDELRTCVETGTRCCYQPTNVG